MGQSVPVVYQHESLRTVIHDKYTNSTCIILTILALRLQSPKLTVEQYIG